MSPHKIEYWYNLDLQWLLECDCIIRLQGESTGADEEVRTAHNNSMDIFYSLEEWLGSL
jgi:hypothetical protein